MVLVTPDERRVLVYVIGDNPFANESLVPLVGNTVDVTGRWRGNRLRVSGDDVARYLAARKS